MLRRCAWRSYQLSANTIGKKNGTGQDNNHQWKIDTALNAIQINSEPLFSVGKKCDLLPSFDYFDYLWTRLVILLEYTPRIWTIIPTWFGLIWVRSFAKCYSETDEQCNKNCNTTWQNFIFKFKMMGKDFHFLLYDFRGKKGTSLSPLA